MRPRFILLVLFIGIGCPEHAAAASFDCSKATTQGEKLICDDEQLSLQDDLLAKAYEAALSLSKNVDEQKAKQRQWLKSVRKACTDTTCLSMAYSKRISELKEITLPENDPKVCGGDIKKVLDLAHVVDGKIPETARSQSYGKTNDGSLNYGGYWLRTDISLLYARLRCWQSAREVIGKIAQEGLQEVSKANLSIEYAKAGYFTRAIDVLDSLESSEEAFPVSAYGIASALVVAGRAEQAKEVIMRVTTRWSHFESPSFWLIKSLVEAGRINEAEKMIEGIDHTWNEYLLLAKAYMKSGKKDLAESHIQNAVSMAGHDSDAAAFVQGQVAYIYIDNRDFVKSYTFASEIPRPLDRLQALLRLAEALHHAKKMVERMRCIPRQS